MKITTKIYPEIMSERRYWSTPASSCFMGNSVDAELLPFLKQMNSYSWMVTTSCCSGHGEEQPYVSLAVKVSALKRFTELLNRLQTHLDDETETFFACELIFESDVATSCDFEHFPEWIMFHLDFYPPDGIETSEQFWSNVARGVKAKRGRHEKVAA